MYRAKWLWSCSLVLLLATPLVLAEFAADAAEPPSTESAALLADKIILLSGFAGLSDQVRRLADSQVTHSASAGHRKERQQQALMDLMPWAPAPLTQKLRASLNGYTLTEQQEMLDQLLAPLMVQARESEINALSKQHTEEFTLYAQRLKQQPPAQSRLNLISLLDQAMGMSEWLVLAKNIVATEMAKQGVEVELSDLSVRERAQAYLLYAYRFTSNRDIKNIISIWQSPPLSSWSEAAYQSLILPIDSAAPLGH